MTAAMIRETQIDPVVRVAFEPTRRYLLQDAPDTEANVIQFPRVAR